MGIREFKYKLCLNVDLNAILNTAKVWLQTNCFQIKTEIVKPNKAVINSYTGSAIFTRENDAKRWLEIHTKLTSKGNYIILYEKASAWAAGAMKTSLIKDEVMALAAFLQTGCLLSPQHQQQQQQQQIVVNVVPQPPPPPITPPAPSPAAPVHRIGILCPQCHAPIQNANAVFCDRCGQRLVWRNLRVPNEDEDKLSATPSSNSVLFCSACGAPLKPNAAFCKQCGAAVEQIEPDTESDKEQSADVVLQRVQTKIDEIKDDEPPPP